MMGISRAPAIIGFGEFVCRNFWERCVLRPFLAIYIGRIEEKLEEIEFHEDGRL